MMIFFASTHGPLIESDGPPLFKPRSESNEGETPIGF